MLCQRSCVYQGSDAPTSSYLERGRDRFALFRATILGGVLLPGAVVITVVQQSPAALVVLGTAIVLLYGAWQERLLRQFNEQLAQRLGAALER
jgi:hypothetical protein